MKRNRSYPYLHRAEIMLPRLARKEKQRLYELDEDMLTFFLAGPVRGGGNWQARATRLLARAMGPTSFYVAIPCRWNTTHSLWKYCRQDGMQVFDRQMTWERYYLEIAARSGGVIFWLPPESKADPHPGPDPYGMDSRRELGEWATKVGLDSSLKVTVGGRRGFRGLSQIERLFNFACAGGSPLDTPTGFFPVYPTLEETVAAAVGKTTHM